MINKEGKIALTNGQKTRWVSKARAANYAAGWVPVENAAEAEEPTAEDNIESNSMSDVEVEQDIQENE